MELIDKILSKIHIRSFSILIAALFAIAGIYMIYHGIRDEGAINISSAIITGKIKSGLVGVTLVFLGAMISLACIIVKPARQKVKIKTNNGYLEWEGTVNSIRSLIRQMESMVDQLNK